MAETEGTIRFRYTLCPAGAEDALDQHVFAVLEGWRRVLGRLGLVGRDPARYDGFAFGNLSVRDPADPARFFVTASQTVDAPSLAREAVTRVDAADVAAFSVRATGARPPSSEALTHAAVYQADATTGWLFHAHCPEIWRQARRLALPETGAGTPYGTPALAGEVAALLARHPKRPIVFVTPGHEDGVFACGTGADEVGAALLVLLARATALESQ